MRRILWIVVTAILLMACLAGCSGGMSKADLSFYDENGLITESLEDVEWERISCGEDEYTSRKIGVGSTYEEFEKAYQDIWGRLFHKESYSDSATLYFDCGDAVMSVERTIDGDESVIESIEIRTKDDYEEWEFIFAMSTFRSNAEMGDPMFFNYRGIYDKFIGSLTEEEKLLVNKLAAHTDTQEYKNESFFEFDAENKGEDLTWLSKEEQKMTMSIYDKFKKNYDFGY